MWNILENKFLILPTNISGPDLLNALTLNAKLIICNLMQ